MATDADIKKEKAATAQARERFKLEKEISQHKKDAASADGAALDALLKKIDTKRKKLKVIAKEQSARESEEMSYAMKAQELDAMRLDLGKKFLSVSKDGNGEIVRRTQEYYKQGFAAHKFLETEMQIGNRVERMNESTQFGASLLESSDDTIKKIGMDYAGFVDSQDKSLTITQDLMKNYDKLGGSTFQDLTGAAEEQLDLVEKQGIYLKNELIPGIEEEILLRISAGESAEDLVKTLAELKKVQRGNLADAKLNVAQAKEQKVIHEQTAAAAELITGPFKKLQGILESTPMGKMASSIIGVDDVMKDFTKGSEKSMKAFLKSGGTNKLMLTNIQNQGKKAIKSLTAGFKGFFKMMLANPMMLMVAGIVAAAMALKKLFGGFTELRKEMGLTFGAAAELQSNINITAARFKFMGVSAEDVKGVVGGIQENWGGVGQATEENISLLTGLNAEFGISGEHSSKLVTQMMAVGSVSREAAAAQLESVGNLARASGVAPAAIMADVAESTEFFAGFAKDGGDNMFKTAIAAKKLGLNLGTAEKIAESLLDFESSIEAQMEASMMTGRAINTDRARELMLAGDTEGMMKEVSKQLGSQADWNALNIAQRKSVAKSFGLEVSEVGNMMAEKARLANMTQAEIEAEEERAEKQEESGKIMSDIMMFLGDLWAEILIAAKNLWPVIKGIGIALAIAFFPITLAIGAVMLVVKAFNWLNKQLPGVGTALTVISAILAAAWMSSKGIGGSFLKWIPGLDKVGKKLTGMTDTLKDKAKEKMGAVKDKAKEKMGAAADKVTGKGTKDKTKAVKKPKTSKSIGGKKGGKGGFGFMEKIKPKKMIQGAAALLIAAAAMWVAAKALQEFGKVTWTAIAMAGVTLLGLTLVLAILGQLKGQLIQGAVAMLIMSIALIPFAFALQMFTGVDFAQVALGGVAMIGFALAMGLLGFAAPFIIAGAAAVAIMGIALMPFAVALGLFTGIDFEQVKIGGVAMLGLGLALGALGFMAPFIMMGAAAMAIMAVALLPFAVALGLFTGIDLEQVKMGGAAMLGLGLALGALGFMAPFIMMGAAAMAIMAVALLPFAVALGLFTGIDFAQVALGGAAMLGLGLALGALGFMAPFIIMGAWALGIMSLALLGFGVALVLIGTGMKMISGSFSSITEEITEMASMYENIGLLAKSFFVLGRSMSSMALGALMLLPALPVLIALNKMGMFGGVSLGGGEEATESKEENPVEIKLTETNMKLDKLIALMGKDGIMVENLSGIKKNTVIIAEEAQTG